mmetsp:Transcript_22726/g.49206  ORF Transcript_22726/g.49206 Transcript_22726/m.49206 type:complete len:94 (-) Transcript_22726:544-825(-)
MELHRALGRNGRTTFHKHGHQASISVGAQTEGCDIQQHEILDGLSSLAAQYTSLDSRTHGHRLIGIYSRVGILAIEKLLNELLHLGYARRPSH